MSNKFRKLFNLFPGEEKGAIAFALLAFFWASASTSALKFADALFLLHVGSEHLPALYSLSAGCMILIASLLIYSFHNFAPHRVFIGALSCAAIFYLTVFITLTTGPKDPWVWYILRVFGSVSFAVIGSCFWTFIDQFYPLQEAKRLFSLFNSMIFLGVCTTGIIMLLGLIEFQTLSLMIAIMLLAAIVLILYIQKNEKPVHDDNNLSEEPFSYKKFTLNILKSPFTLLLMGSNLLLYLLMSTTEFNYYGTFDRIFDQGGVAVGDEADANLTLFLGKALAGVSSLNLIFGLFFYSRFLRRFGMNPLLLVTPCLLLITYISWEFHEALWIALLGYFVVEGTNYVIDDSNFNLLLNAVPNRLKNKIRALIETFFEPFGTLIAAGLLASDFIDPKHLGLILSLLLVLIALMLRRRYLSAIWANLAENALRFGRSTFDWFHEFTLPEKKAAEARLLALIRKKEDPSLAIQFLIESKDRAAFPKLLKEVETLSSDDKVSFLKIISLSDFSSDVLVIEQVQKWLMEAEETVLLQEVYWFLAKEGLLHPHKLNDELESDNLKLKGAAILTLFTGRADLSSEEIWANKGIAYKLLSKLFESEEIDAIIVGLHILEVEGSPEDLDIALTYLSYPSQTLQKEAARVVSRMATPEAFKSAPRIAHLLTEVKGTDAREHLLRALGKIGDTQQIEKIVEAAIDYLPGERRIAEEAIASMGLKTTPRLLALLKDTSLEDRARLAAGKVLGKIALFQLRVHLERILKPEIDRALYFYEHWRRLRHSPDFTLLADTLKADYFSVLDFIIQLLGTAGEVEDTELLSRTLRSSYLKIRSQGIETLEKTCEPAIFRMLRPLLEPTADEAPEESLQEVQSILESLRDSPSIADKIVAFTFMKQLNLAGWQQSLKKEMTVSSELFKHFAYELLET